MPDPPAGCSVLVVTEPMVTSLAANEPSYNLGRGQHLLWFLIHFFLMSSREAGHLFTGELFLS